MNRLCMHTTRSAYRSALALAVVLGAALLAAAAPSSAARQQPSLRQETQALVRRASPVPSS